jgi:3-hydroxyisobutyrate dehydrogenase-like beta-hydroxyacid dehydrogenase
MTADTVGWVGLGSIGLPMAIEALSEFHVVGYDTDESRCVQFEEAGGEIRDSAETVAKAADVVFLSLPSDDAVRSVATGRGGVIVSLEEGDILVNTSTVLLETTAALSKACAEAKIGFLDAPVHGGPRNAVNGDLTFLVGADADSLQRTREILDSLGKTIHHVGEDGSGTAIKIASNYMFGQQQLALCEALAMTRAAGVDDATFADVVPDTAGDCYALDRDMERFILPGQFNPEAPQRIVRKDMELAERMASHLGVPLLSGGTSQVYRYAERIGLAEEDTASLVKLFEFGDS